MNNLPAVEFEDQIIVADGGKYRCPFKCHTKGYPAPGWKTEESFRAHLSRCTCSPKAHRSKPVLPMLHGEDTQSRCKSAAAELGLAINDLVCYTGYAVTGPTHVSMRGRRVRVREHEQREYFGARVQIESFSWLGALVINGSIPAAMLSRTLREARAKAVEAQHEYESQTQTALAA